MISYAPGPITIVVKMIDKSATSYEFEPATIEARAGDVIRFTQTGTMPHNVDFTSTPIGVELGDQKTSGYMTTVGQTIDITIDKRFTAGTYVFNCTPHASMGMKGVLKIGVLKIGK